MSSKPARCQGPYSELQHIRTNEFVINKLLKVRGKDCELRVKEWKPNTTQVEASKPCLAYIKNINQASKSDVQLKNQLKRL